jgi:integrase
LDIGSFRDYLVSLGLTKSSVRRDMSFIKKMFAEAKNQEIIRENPAQSISNEGRTPENKRAPIPLEVLRKILAAIPESPRLNRAGTADEWKVLIYLAFYTGGRLREVVDLNWSQVDLVVRKIDLRRSKTNDNIIRPLHADLHALLVDYRSRCCSDTTRVLPKLTKQPSKSISRDFRRTILPLGGIEQPYKKPGVGVGRTPSRFSFHSLRHTYVTLLHQSGAPESLLKILVGHSDSKVHALYYHPDESGFQKAVASLPALSG